MSEALWQKFRAGDFSGVMTDINAAFVEAEVYEAIHVGGLSLLRLGLTTHAVNWLCASLCLCEPNERRFVNAIDGMRLAKVLDVALQYSDEALKEYPDSAAVLTAKACVLLELNQAEDACGLLERALKINPDLVTAKQAYGFALQILGRWGDAMTVYDTISNVPDEVAEDVHHNRAWSLIALRRHRDALDYIHAYCKPTARTTYNASMLEIGLGEWPQAWDHYRARRDAMNFPEFAWERIPLPFADTAEDLDGKRVVMFGEQGFGDNIQFVRYASLIAQRAKSLKVLVAPGLKRLVETMAVPNVEVITELPIKDIIETADLAVPMMDCPWVFRTTADAVPADVPYFKVPAANPRPLPWTGRLHVGLLWAGSSRMHDKLAYAIDQRRSIPFEVMSKLLDLSDMFEFVSLQKSDRAVDDPRIKQPIQDDFDFYDTAAVIDQLDLVIAVDSAVAHLAGALGKDVWLLNRYDNCWRWFWDGRHDTPWYPTMKLFYQEKQSDWETVIGDVHQQLTTYFTG